MTTAAELDAPRADIRTRFQYYEPKSVEEAVKLLKDGKGKVRIIAGGQDMMGSLKVRAAKPRYTPDMLLSIHAIPGLDKVEAGADGMRIGSLVTLKELRSNPIVAEKFPSLAFAAGHAATLQIQNAATLGGNLSQDSWCWYYRQEDWRFPCLRKGGDVCFVATGDDRYEAILDPGPCFCVNASDTAAVLVSLDAQAVIAGPNGTRTIPLSDYFVHSNVDPKVTNITDPAYEKATEFFLTQIQIPTPRAGAKAVYLKQTLRSAWEHSRTGAAVAAVVAVNGGAVAHARIVVGGVSSVPYSVPAAEQMLVGKPLSAALLDQVAAKMMEKAVPMRENRYKQVVARTLVKRAVAEAGGMTL